MTGEKILKEHHNDSSVIRQEQVYTEAVGKMFPQVHIIKGDGNLFWNRGMYMAWQAAIKEKDYDFYLWLND